jgi:cysteinyl-tRNA synthetase
VVIQITGVTANPEIVNLIVERNKARKAKNFVEADRIRKELEAAGILLEDKPGGVTEWRRK